VPWHRFTAGKWWFTEGYPSALWPAEVVYNARCMLGQPYRLLNFNCQDYAYRCHGKSTVTQVAALGVAAVLGVVLVAATR
jgi:hypothetical protein